MPFKQRYAQHAMLRWPIQKLKRTWRGLGVRLRRWGYALGATVFAPFLAVRLVSGLETATQIFEPYRWIGYGISIISLHLLLHGWILRLSKRRHEAATLTHDDRKGSGLQIGEHPIEIQNATIRHAFVTPSPNDPATSRLSIETKGGREYELTMKKEDADAWLKAARWAPEDRAVALKSYMTSGIALGLLGLLLFLPILLLASLSSLGSIFLIGHMADTQLVEGLLYALIVYSTIGFTYLNAADILLQTMRGLFGQTLLLGTDGIRWGKGPWRKFLAYRDIARIDFSSFPTKKAFVKQHLILRTHDQKEHRINIRGFRRNAASIIQARLRHALKRNQTSPDLPQLNRQGRTPEAWRQAMRTLLDARDHYRNASLSHAQVKHVLEDADAPAEQRLGAAMALVEAGDDTVHPILVRVCDSIANPELEASMNALRDEAATKAPAYAEVDETSDATQSTRKTPR